MALGIKEIRTLLPFLVGVSLSCAKAKPEPAPIPIPPAVALSFKEVEQRLLREFLEQGTWVVSRNASGSAEHTGDSLIWSGIALSVLPCADGNSIEAGLIKDILDHKGSMQRYSSGDPASLDGMLGAYLGIAYRIINCPESPDSWAPAIISHLDFVNKGGTSLGGFHYALDLIAFHLGLVHYPNGANLTRLQIELDAWAEAVKLDHAAAYRDNLCLITLQTVELLGRPTKHDGLCAATSGVDIPTLDHFCGRADIKSWVTTFKYDQWEYRHQRSGAWESPDGQGIRTPGLDYLVGVKLGFTTPQ